MKKLNIWFVIFSLAMGLFSQEADVSYYVETLNDNTGRLNVVFQFPEEYHQSYSEDFFYFNVEEQEGIEWATLEYPEGIEEKGILNYYDQAILSREFYYEGDLPSSFQITAAYQLCDDAGICLIPQQKNIEAFISGDITMESSSIRDLSWLYFILLAFLGGILLNLMPCVLPLLSVKALNLVNQREGNRRGILWNSWAYGAGILFSMLILGTLVILIQASGKKLGWGFQFQSPWFLFILTALIMGFALSLFDVYIINQPNIQAGANRKGLGGSFLTGIFAVIVATPCTAPFMGSALGFAFSQSPGIIYLIFSSLGLGFAMPFILLGLFPKWIKRIPKAGPWMNTFKEIMAFLLLATAVYLLSSLYKQIGDRIVSVFWTLLILAASLWWLGKTQNPKWSKRKKRIGLFLALTMAVAPLFLILDLEIRENTTLSIQGDETISFDPERIAVLRAEEVPIFLEFTADWCTTCKINHNNVLDKNYRKELFDDLGIVYMVGDFTLADETIATWLQGFGRAGVPLYVYYPPGKDPVVLPEILTRENLENAIFE